MTSTASPLITSAEESLQIGSESNWDNFQFPIPDDMVIVTTDTLKFRLGTGTALFNTLSTEATIAGVKTGESNLVNTLSELQPGDNNNIITIAGGIFDASSTSPSSLSSSLTGVANVDAIQNSNLSAITSQFGTISTGINNTNINDLAILGGHQITQGENITALNYVIPINPLSITSIIAYSDKECTKPVSFFYDSTSYYIKVSASDDNVDSGLLSYTLTSNSSFITLEPLGHGLYEAIVGLVPAGSVAFTGGVEYSTGSASSTISINVSSVPPMSITSFGVFADLGCSQSVTSFNNNTTYYAQINAYGGGGSVSVDTYGLNSDNTNITITNLGNGIFSLAVGVVPTTTTTELSATASYGTFNASSSMTVDLNSWPAIIIESVSGSGSIGLFSDAACTQAVTSFNNNTTYYAKLTVLGGAGNSNTYALTSNNSYVVVTAVGAGVFSLAVGADPNPDSVLLSATVTCSNTNANTSVTATLNSWPAINISSVGVFSDSGCTQVVTSFNNNTTYYAKVVATGGSPSNTYSLTSNNASVVVAQVSGGVFSLTVGVIPTPGTVTLSTTVACSDGNNTSATSVTLNSWPAIVISSVGVFSDSGCTQSVTYFNSNTTYYAKVVATGGAGAANTYALTSNNASVVVSAVGSGVFSLTVGTVPTAGTVTLTPTVTCSDGNATTTLSVQVNTPLSITSVTMYSDSGCTVPCSSFYNSVTYYCKVIPAGGGGSQGSDVYTLTSNNAGVTVTSLGNGVFSLAVGTIASITTLTVTATVTVDGNNATTTKTASLLSAAVVTITSITTYSDSGCTVPCSSFYNGVTYYAKIVPSGGGGSQTTDTYTLTSNNGSVVVSAVGNGVFSLAVGTPSSGSVTLTGTAAFTLNGSTSTGTSTQTATLLEIPPVTISSITTYSDAGCTIQCSSFYNGVTYYAKIVPSGGGGSQTLDTYTLSSNNSGVTVNPLGNGVFSLAVGTIASTGSVVLTATAAYGASSATTTQTATLLAYPPVSITSVTTYSDAGCTIPCNSFFNGSTYYAKVVPAGGGTPPPVYLANPNGLSMTQTTAASVSAGGHWDCATSNITIPAGKWYWEELITGTGNGYIISGVLSDATGGANGYPGAVATGAGYYSSNGDIWHNGVDTAWGGPTTVAGDVIGIAFDQATGNIWFSKNGVWMNNGNPATGANPAATLGSGTPLYVGVAIYQQGGSVSMQFSAATQQHSAPAGFSSLLVSTEDTCTLTSNNAGVTVSQLSNTLFSLTVGTPSAGTLTLTANATYGASSASTTQTATLLALPPVTISSITTYSDSGCTVPCSSFYNGVTYYAKIVPSGGGGSQTTDTYTLSSSSGNVTVAAVGNGVFSLAVGTVPSSGTLTLTGTASFTLSGNLSSGTTTQTASLLAVSVVTISSISCYADSGCTIPVTSLNNGVTYYSRVVPAGGGGSQATDTYTLTSNNANVTTAPVANGVFSVTVGTVPSSTTLTLTGTASFTLSGSTSSASSTDVLPLTAQAQISISSITAYSDAGCTIPVTVFNNGTTYYAKIVPANGGGSQNNDTYTLTSNNANVTPTNVGNGVFSLAVGTVPSLTTLTLTGSANYAGNSASTTAMISLSAQAQISISSIGVFFDSGCTIPVTLFNNNTTYYCKVVPAGGGGSQSGDTYTLTSNNSGVVVSAVGNGVFSLAVGSIASSGSVVLTATVAYGGNTSTTTNTTSLTAQAQISVSSLGVFADSGCTIPVTEINNNTTYYAQIIPVGGGGSQSASTPITLANANGLSITSTTAASISGGNWDCATSNITIPAGKWYWETTITNNGGSNYVLGGVTSNAAGGGWPGSAATGVGFDCSGGDIWTNGSQNSGYSTTKLTTGDVLGIAIDQATGNVWFSKNGVWIAGGNPATGANPAATLGNSAALYAAVSIYNSPTAVSLQFSAASQKYSAPSGFSAITTTADTYTLTSNNAGVTVAAVGNGVFSLAVATPSAGTLTLTGTASFDGNTSTNATKTATLSGQSQISVSSIGVFADSGCTIPVTEINNNTTYYANVISSGGGGSQSTDTYTLSSNNSSVVVSAVGNGVFSLAVATPTAGTLTLTATAAFGGNTSTAGTKTATLSGAAQISISSIGVFSDSGCTIPVTELNNSLTYYSKIVPVGGGGSQSTDTYTLTSNNAGVVPTVVGNGVYSLAVGTIASAGTVTLTGTAAFGGNTATSTATPSLSAQAQISVSSIGVFFDSGCTIPVTIFSNSTTYYAKVVPAGGGGSQSTDTYTLSSNNSSVVVSAVGNGVFSLAVATPTAGTLTLTATDTFGGDTSTNATQTVTLAGTGQLSITNIGFYSDSGCTNAITEINNSTVCYAKIFVAAGTIGSQTTDTFALSSNNGGVVTAAVGNGVFSLTVGTPTAGTLTLTGTATYGGNSATTTRTSTLSGQAQISVGSIGLYSNSGCTLPVTVLNNNLTYYAQVVPAGGGGSQSTDTYTLSSNNSSVVVAAVGNGVFSLAVATPTAGTLTLTATDTFGGNTSGNATQTATLSGVAQITAGMNLYADSGCTTIVAVLNNSTIYYAKIVPTGGGGSQSTDTYTLSSNNAGVVVTSNLGNGVFKITVGTPSAGTVQLTGTASYGGNTSSPTNPIWTVTGQAQITVASVKIYTTSACTTQVTTLYDDITYYAQVVPAGGGGSQSGDTYTLTSNNGSVSVSATLGSGVFPINVGQPAAGTLTLTATASYGGNTSVSNTGTATLAGPEGISVGYSGVFSDSGCTQGVGSFNNNTYYYVKFTASETGWPGGYTWGCSSNNGQVAITYNYGNGIFQIYVYTVPYGGATLTLTGSASANGQTGYSYPGIWCNGIPGVYITGIGWDGTYVYIYTGGGNGSNSYGISIGTGDCQGVCHITVTNEGWGGTTGCFAIVETDYSIPGGRLSGPYPLSLSFTCYAYSAGSGASAGTTVTIYYDVWQEIVG